MSRDTRLRVAAKVRAGYSEAHWKALVAYDQAQAALERHLGRHNCTNLSDRGEHKTDAGARAEHIRLIETRDKARRRAARLDEKNHQ